MRRRADFTGRERESGVPADSDWFDYRPVSETPLDPATASEAARLPPGYSVFSVESAERGLLKSYPYVTRLSDELPPGVTPLPGLVCARYG